MNTRVTGEVNMSEAQGFKPDPEVRVRDYRIGCIGAGMIMAECHLAAYKEAGFKVVAIASSMVTCTRRPLPVRPRCSSADRMPL